MDNPTQAGYYADGWAGNPIGQFGTSSVTDQEEFISVEDDGLVVEGLDRARPVQLGETTTCLTSAM